MKPKGEAVGFCFRSPSPFWWGTSPDGPQNSWDFKSLLEAACDRVIEDRFAVQIHRTGIVSIFLEHNFDVVTSPAKLSDDNGNILDEFLGHRAEAIRDLNALSLCINSAVTLHAGFDPGATLISAENLQVLMYDDQGNLTGPAELAETLRIPWRSGETGVASLDAGLLLFESVIAKKAAGALGLVALLNEALWAYKQYNFSLCVVAAWSICERLQSVAWQEYIEAAGERDRIRLNSRVRKDLGNGRDYTASVVATVLQLAGVLTADLAQQLKDARSARNSWLHAGRVPSRFDAANCIEAAVEMLERVLNIRAPVGMTLSIRT